MAMKQDNGKLKRHFQHLNIESQWIEYPIQEFYSKHSIALLSSQRNPSKYHQILTFIGK